ncbi:MAG TPA: 30S ribosomal protein S8 [Candidatus Saccharimonadia bacterium]|nr:30S ribosomal protein S8 [Candidatus Saccharimonadia bacterium]
MSTITIDPIADMLTRIRNAIAVSKNEVNIPYSKFKEDLAKILKKYQLIENYKVVQEDDALYKVLNIEINKPFTNPNINTISKISTPGRRVYARSNNIPTVRSGRGLVILSTSYGLMTGSEAKSKKIGGELICRIY